MKLMILNQSEPSVYPVFKVKYELDSNGIPIDIVITADNTVLQEIADKWSEVGCNIQIHPDVPELSEGLFARLPEFQILAYESAHVEYEAFAIK